MHFQCLATRVHHSLILTVCSEGTLKLQHEPILDGSSGVLAAAYTDHDDGEEEEEAGHGKAHAVHRLVAHDDITVDLALYKCAFRAETWNLTT